MERLRDSVFFCLFLFVVEFLDEECVEFCGGEDFGVFVLVRQCSN